MGSGGSQASTRSGPTRPVVPPWAISLQNGGRRASSGDVLTPQNAADSTVMSMPDLASHLQSRPAMDTPALAAKDESSSPTAFEALGDDDEDEDDEDDDEDEINDTVSGISDDATDEDSPEPARIMSDLMMEAAQDEAKQPQAPARVQSEPTAAVSKPQAKSFASSSKIMALQGMWQEQHARDQAAQNHVPNSIVNTHNSAVNDMIPASKPSASKKRRISVSSSSGSDIPDFLPGSTTNPGQDAPALPFPDPKRIKFGEANGRAFISTENRLTEGDLKAALLANQTRPSDSPQATMSGTPDSDVKPSRATAKATPISRRPNPVATLESTDNEEDFEDADGDEDDEDEDVDEDDDEDGDGDNDEDMEPSRVGSTATEEQHTPVPAPSVPSSLLLPTIPEHIMYSTDGRLYTTFPDVDGGSRRTNGAVFPTGYKMYESSLTPFICAVRDCQRLLPNVMSLGAHLGAKHCRMMFNDNLDGTMTYLGPYTTPKGVRAPPIIVSQNPIGPDAPSPAEAMVPAYVMGRIREAQAANTKLLNKNLRAARPKMMVTMKYPYQQGSASSTTPSTSESLPKIAHKMKKPKAVPLRIPDTIPPDEPRTRSTPSATFTATGAVPDYGPRSTRRAAIEANAAIQATAATQVNAPSRPSTSTRSSTAAQIQTPIPPPRPSVATPQMLVSAGNAVPGNILEMEEWEVAPGRIRDDSSAIPENIAFSNSFVSSGQEIPISSDVSFNVLTIKPGGSVQFQANIGKLRVCSLAAGKLQVKMGPHDFAIGPNGMFKVRDSDFAVVTNRLYLDSVLHVSSVKEY